MKHESVIVGALETNCYLVYCQETLECAIIDPGAEPEKILRLIGHKGLKPTILINTHGHVDHIGANRDIKDTFDIPICLHKADSSMFGSVLQFELSFLLGAKESPPPDRFLEEGDTIKTQSRSAMFLSWLFIHPVILLEV
jgi:glyoxylase-like metal-dependent hydrolase (beta-lactamase superfamily II)